MSPGQLRSQVLCLAALWGGACLFSLSLFWSVILFSVSCFLVYKRSADQDLLPVDQKAVLVTGGDCGFGHALAKHLDQVGYTVFAGVLNENGSGAEELRRTCSKRLSVLQMDVTNTQQIKDAYSKVAEKVQDRGLWAVINNAGILGFPMDGELIPMDDYRKCMAVNYFGAVEVTKTFLPLLRKSKGRLVNMSSMGGGFPLQKLSAYNTTKAALTMFSSIMRQELSQWGVKVSVIQPGGFRTSIAGTRDMWDKKLRDILDHLPQEVREDYGQEYILHHKKILNGISTLCNPDLSPVLQDVHHAISAKSPFAFYAPGKLVSLCLYLAALLPTSFLDYLEKMQFSDKQYKPRALSRAK